MTAALVIGGLVVVGLLLFWKVVLPDLRENFQQMAGFHRQMGAARFWLTMVGVLAYIGIGATLSFLAVWPGNCDHEGRRLTGFIKQFNCSPDLLSGGAVEIALFVWLWSLPTICIVVVAWSWINHFRRKRAR